jgi:hypothetical protein
VRTLIAIAAFFAIGSWTDAVVSTAAWAHCNLGPGTKKVRQILASSVAERDIEELRASHEHTDYYSVLRLEIEALRRETPEHGEFLDRYLQSQLPR